MRRSCMGELLRWYLSPIERKAGLMELEMMMVERVKMLKDIVKGRAFKSPNFSTVSAPRGRSCLKPSLSTKTEVTLDQKSASLQFTASLSTCRNV